MEVEEEEADDAEGGGGRRFELDVERFEGDRFFLLELPVVVVVFEVDETMTRSGDSSLLKSGFLSSSPPSLSTSIIRFFPSLRTNSSLPNMPFSSS